MRGLSIGLSLLFLCVCCQKKDDASSGAPASTGGSEAAQSAGVASSSAPSTAAETPKALSPLTEAQVQKVTNPGKRAPYAGPAGVVKGLVRVTGDASPPLDLGKTKVPLGDCFEAHAMYKSLLREGPNRALADVLVAVTGYEGYVPAEAPTRTIEAKGCAFETRTASLMYGQTLGVANVGKAAVTPQLMGAKTQALLIAMPGGEPVQLFPQRVGLYKLVDRSHEFAFADVYVVAYPTTAVTGLDGRFEIGRVPVGDVTVSALLPATGQTVERKVTVKADEPVELILDFELDAEVLAKDLKAAREKQSDEPSTASTSDDAPASATQGSVATPAASSGQ